MGTAIFTQVLNGVQTQVTSLGLTLNNVTVPVVVRKIPTKEHMVDSPAQITVSRAPVAEKIKYCFTQSFVKYPVDVVFIGPNDNDQSTNLDAELGFRQSIRKQFITQPSLGITGTGYSQREIRPQMDVLYDPKLVASNYDVSVVRLWVEIVEPGQHS